MTGRASAYPDTADDILVGAARKARTGVLRLDPTLFATVLLTAALALPGWTSAQEAGDGEPPTPRLEGARLKQRADGVLTLMAFTVLPDITTSSLSIDNARSGNPGISQGTLGGGFTLSEGFPLYLEGTLGWSRYDPKFLATDGREQRRIPTRWNSVSATGGIGWDVPLVASKELTLRPIFNFTLGHVETDASIAERYINYRAGTDLDLDFLKRGRMSAYGLGGALMLDYERYRENYEIDVELRYTHINLTSFEESHSIVRGSSDAKSASLWARWRAPTGVSLLQRPLRYLLEASNTSFFGPQRDALGFNYLTSVGVGLELDSSAYPVFITRTRLVGRYIFGENVSGYSVGLAMSF
jgi:hypothetical protein